MTSESVGLARRAAQPFTRRLRLWSGRGIREIASRSRRAAGPAFVTLLLTVSLTHASATEASAEVVVLAYPASGANNATIAGFVRGVDGRVLFDSDLLGVMAAVDEWVIGAFKSDSRVINAFMAWPCDGEVCQPVPLLASIRMRVLPSADDVVDWFVAEGGEVVERIAPHRAILRGPPALIDELGRREDVFFHLLENQGEKNHCPGCAGGLTPPFSDPDTEAHLGPGWPFVARATLHVDGWPLRAESRELSRDSAAFFAFDPDNAELVLKILDGCGVNGYHWVYASGLTDLPVDLVIEDRRSGETRSYSSPGGSVFPGVADVEAFPCDPSG
jgi:hypothetical protein